MTKEQFDNLKIGDVIVDSTSGDEYTIVDRLTNILFAEDDCRLISYYSYFEIKEDYSIKEAPKHLYGIPYGDYSDKEVYVVCSDESLDQLSKSAYKLYIVDDRGFTLQNGLIFKFAKVISNNVDLIKDDKY